MIASATCPQCDASAHHTHYTGCRYAGVDPRNIPSPLNDLVCVEFYATGDLDPRDFVGMTLDEAVKNFTLRHSERSDDIVSTMRGQFRASLIVELLVGGRRCQAYFGEPGQSTRFVDPKGRCLYERNRADYLHMCRGYWQGTTCGNKRDFQRALANLRQAFPYNTGV